MGAAGGGKAKGAISHGVQTALGELQERDLQRQAGEPEGGRKRQVGGHRDALASMVLSPPPGPGPTDILPCPWSTQGKGPPPTRGSAGPREVGPAAWVAWSPLQRVPDGPGKLAGVPAQELAQGSQTARELRPSPFIQQILIDTQDLLGWAGHPRFWWKNVDTTLPFSAHSGVVKEVCLIQGPHTGGGCAC